MVLQLDLHAPELSSALSLLDYGGVVQAMGLGAEETTDPRSNAFSALEKEEELCSKHFLNTSSKIDPLEEGVLDLENQTGECGAEFVDFSIISFSFFQNLALLIKY